MIQETGVLSQPFNVAVDERQLILRQLHRDLDPFQEGLGAERLRAIGLNNLFLRMADPSLEFVEAVADGMAKTPFSNLRQLQFDTYDAGQDPRQYFTKYGIRVDNPEELSIGLDNTLSLLDDFIHKYDYETGELNWGAELDPKTLAESTHEWIQISQGERQLREAIKQIYDESSLHRRYHMGLDLKGQVLTYINSFSFSFFRSYERDKPMEEPIWESLATRYSDLSTQLETKDGGTTVGSFGIEDAVDTAEAAITRYSLEKKLKQLPSKDRERFDQLRLQYGAKAANLIILSELVGDINRLRKHPLFGSGLVVPDFQVVPVDSYRAWREGKLIDNDLYPYFEWASGLKEDRWLSDEPTAADFIVRSSAVFSEDGENVTGAGVYESVRVNGGSAFKDLKEAVVKVYQSTDSEQARAYREQHGIGEEEMGLVIQKYISPDSFFSIYGQSQQGYINSRLSGVPQLMEIVTGTSRNFIKRKTLDLFLAMDPDRNEHAFKSLHHFLPDQYRINPGLVIKVAQFTEVVERIWGRDIQIEFVANGSTINFVQVRELPISLTSQAAEIQFPDESPRHTGAAIGVGDMELSLLNDKDDNSERKGVVLLGSNYGWTMRDNIRRLPKEGAVIIFYNNGKNGHIQTLCAERGLVCIFPVVNEDENRSALRYDELLGLKNVRVVSNGIEGRVYVRRKRIKYNSLLRYSIWVKGENIRLN